MHGTAPKTITFSPNIYKAGISLFGMSDLEYEHSREQAHTRGFFNKEIGDATSLEGVARLRWQSPVNHVSDKTSPMLVYHGLKDTLVCPSHSISFSKKLIQCGGEVELLLSPEEAHGFSQSENEMAVYLAIEQFLAKELGGVVGKVPNTLEIRMDTLRNQGKEALAGSETPLASDPNPKFQSSD